MVKRAIGAVLLAVIVGTSAHAQTTVHTLWGDRMSLDPALDSEYRFLSVDPDARQILRDRQWTFASTFFGADLYITPDGALMVANGYLGTLTLRNLATDSVSSFSLPFGPSFLFGNPTRPEIFMGDPAGIVALSASGFRRVSSRKCGYPNFSHASLSLDGRRLAISCMDSGPFRGAVVDTASGVDVVTFTSADLYFGLTLSRDGQEFYALSPGPNLTPTTWLRRYAVSTETVLGEVLLPYYSLSANSYPADRYPAVQVDPRTGRLFIKFDRASPMRVYDPSTLQELRTFPSSTSVVSRLAFDPHHPRAYAAVTDRPAGEPPGTVVNSVSIIDTDALEVLFTAQVGSDVEANLFALPPPAIVVAPRPAAPTGLAATVAGTSVELSWAPGPPPGIALRYVLEAGSGPGLANLATFDVGLQTSVIVNGVPPGTYYVRLRPANVTGSGQPSNEIVVTVP